MLHLFHGFLGGLGEAMGFRMHEVRRVGDETGVAIVRGNRGRSA